MPGLNAINSERPNVSQQSSHLLSLWRIFLYQSQLNVSINATYKTINIPEPLFLSYICSLSKFLISFKAIAVFYRTRSYVIDWVCGLFISQMYSWLTCLSAISTLRPKHFSLYNIFDVKWRCDMLVLVWKQKANVCISDIPIAAFN